MYSYPKESIRPNQASEAKIPEEVFIFGDDWAQ